MRLAEFKRTIKKGDFVTMTENTLFPTNALLGKRRRVMAVNTVDLIVECEKDGQIVGSYSPFPKASDFECDGTTFTFVRHNDRLKRIDRISFKWEPIPPLKCPTCDSTDVGLCKLHGGWWCDAGHNVPMTNRKALGGPA